MAIDTPFYRGIVVRRTRGNEKSKSIVFPNYGTMVENPTNSVAARSVDWQRHEA